MGELATGAGTLDGIASKLRDSAGELEGAASSPPTPEAGACTGAVLAALNFLAESAAGVSEGLTAIGDAVADGNTAFDENERHAEKQLNPRGPN